MRKSYNWMTDRGQEIGETAKLARRAVDLTGNVEHYLGPAMEHRPRLIEAVRGYAGALAASGFALAYVVGELDNGAALIDRALALNPNLASAWHYSGWAKIWLGERDLAIEHLARATRYSPFDPLIEWMQAATAHAHFFAGRYGEASAAAGMALRTSPDTVVALRIAAASNALAGEFEQARKLLSRLRQLDPTLRVSNLRDRLGPYRRAEDTAKYEEGVRKAGLPE